MNTFTCRETSNLLGTVARTNATFPVLQSGAATPFSRRTTRLLKVSIIWLLNPIQTKSETIRSLGPIVDFII